MGAICALRWGRWILLCLVCISPVHADDVRLEFTERHMGMEFRLILYAPNADSANRASRAAFDRIAALDKTCSDYDPQSELMRLCKSAVPGEPVGVSTDLVQILTAAQSLAARSDGAFDVTCGPLVQLWRRSKRQRALPSEELLSAARAAVGYKLLTVNAEQKTVTLAKAGMRLDLGGIACGYAIEEARQVLAAHGITRCLVDGSGDMQCGEPPPGKTGWRVGLAPLAGDGPATEFLNLHNQAITTSGDAYQFVEIGGVRYSHIVDPATGLGLTHRCSVTVVAPKGIDADSLTKVVCVLGPERGLKWIDATPGAAARIITLVDGQPQVAESLRWKDLPRTPAS